MEFFGDLQKIFDGAILYTSRKQKFKKEWFKNVCGD